MSSFMTPKAPHSSVALLMGEDEVVPNWSAETSRARMVFMSTMIQDGAKK